MKKVFAVAALSVFALASCKGDYTCSCEFDGGTSESVMTDVKKKDAEDACDALDAQVASMNGSCTLN